MTAPAICRSSPASSPINLRRSFAAERTARAIFVPHEAEQAATHEMVALRAQGRPLNSCVTSSFLAPSVATEQDISHLSQWSQIRGPAHRSLIAFEQISTLVIAVELSQSSWLGNG